MPFRLFVFLIWALICLPVANARAAEDSAFVPLNPPKMKRLLNHDSPAYQTAKLFLRGANLGNYLESPPHGWSVTIAAGEFAIMKAQGFDHVRVPVRWNAYTGPAPDFSLSPEIFARVDFVVTNALAAKLAVLINIHDFDAFTSDPADQTDKFLAIWRQIAAHYAAYGNAVAFELLNEPKDAATTSVVNPIWARAITEIRKTNPHRTIFVGPGKWNQVSELKNLILPPDDNNLIVSVHCYDPFYFTHQGASWAGPDVKVTGIQFPGPPGKPLVPDAGLKLNNWVIDWIDRYNTLPTEQNPSSPLAFSGELKLAHEWSDYYGRPVHVGEFGAFVRADPESRVRFYAAFRRTCEQDSLGWAMWDWSANFRYWDRRANQPVKGMHDALFKQ